jgi:hypothetical protein
MTARQDKIDAAAQAEALMRSELMTDFFERAEKQLFEQWKNVSLDEDAQKELHLKYLGLQAFKEFMHVVIVDGQLARRELERTNP